MSQTQIEGYSFKKLAYTQKKKKVKKHKESLRDSSRLKETKETRKVKVMHDPGLVLHCEK